MNKSGIYKITNTINGKFYIGSSCRIEQRWREHVKDLNQNKHTNKQLQRSWNKHGQNAFEFEILEFVNKNDLFSAEQQMLNRCWDGGKTCYNMSKIAKGGNTGKTKKPVLQIDIETNTIIREWPSASDIEKEIGVLASNVRSVCKGKTTTAGGYKWRWANPNLSKKYNPNTRTHGGHGKREVCWVDADGNIVETYNSLSQAAAKHKCSYNAIIAVCKGRKMSLDGKMFKYKNELYITQQQEKLYLCKICGAQNSTKKGLATHIQFSHKISTEEYTRQHLLLCEPKCSFEGCNNTPRYVSFVFRKFCIEHQAEAMRLGGQKNKKVHNCS